MKTTEENNRLIAEFMEYPTKKLAGRITDELALSIYNDYNSIIPIVEKIEAISKGSAVVISENTCTIFVYIDENFKYLKNMHGETKLQATYQAVVQFIEWYNEQQKS